MNHLISAACLSACLLFIGCSDKSASNTKELHIEYEAPVLDTLLISDEQSLHDYDCETIDSIEKYIILREDDNTMYAEIDRLINAYNRFFILDAYGSRKVVSFDQHGNSITAYGKRGNGPGEYILPWAIDVSDKYVYILDASQQKILRYSLSGSYIDSSVLPYNTRSFIHLNDGNILLHIEPEATDMRAQLCLTDSTLKPIKMLLTYPEGQVMNWVTNNVFRKLGSLISFYASPADTIYLMDLNGNLVGKRVLQFKQGSIPDEAKLNLSEYRHKGLLKKGIHLRDNPLETKHGVKFMAIENFLDGKTKILTITSDNKNIRTLTYRSEMSVHDITYPLSTNSAGKVISLLDYDFLPYYSDYPLLPDSIKTALNEGNRVLVIHDIR